ncbi:hypothetical protein Patl1_09595 [Pistacia atlantica]|uniref:Uncharacterized protein n=1 Tax=Pistacia atlantica TaxID=434234 RepID=A0ACC1A6B6_9ROSI|nr:hypothetical protein Patl1_09595 [Pistacia atlantica]
MIRSLTRSALVCSPLYRQSFLFSAPKFTAAEPASFSGRRGGCFNLRAMSASSSGIAGESKVQQQEIKLLDGYHDNYGGVVIKMNEPMDPNLFVSMLKSSISQWRNQGKKGVWIKLPIELVNLVEPAVKEGFWFHHAEPSYLMLVYWIPGGAHSILKTGGRRRSNHSFLKPAFLRPKSRGGKGGKALRSRFFCSWILRNHKNPYLEWDSNSAPFEILRRVALWRAQYDESCMWKIPTGVAEQGEDICMAAVREVKEETSIDAEFVEVLAFRYGVHLKLRLLCRIKPLFSKLKIYVSFLKSRNLANFFPYAHMVRPGCRSIRCLMQVSPFEFGKCYSKDNRKQYAVIALHVFYIHACSSIRMSSYCIVG